jgi:hypothetical protein
MVDWEWNINKKTIVVRHALLALYFAILIAGCHSKGNDTRGLRGIVHPLYGVTIDSVELLDFTVDSISSLSKYPTTRVVFDKRVPASEYTQALNELYPHSYIMGEILDSDAVKDYSVREYRERVKKYLDAHGDKVDIWEIGNEVNGKWLGDPGYVAEKVEDAYHQVEARGYRTALTLDYNPSCWDDAEEEMFNWVETRLTAEMRAGLDYLLVSYYEENCNDFKPDWQRVFNRLGELFPYANLGFGEVGVTRRDVKREYLEEYYTIEVDHPRYIGGYFWWYYIQDMVPKTKPLWTTLDKVLQEQ